MGIGNNLKQFRAESGLSQKEIADTLNVSPQAVSRWENNEVEPDISTLSKLANIYKVSVDELINGKKLEETKQVEESKPIEEAKEEVKETSVDPVVVVIPKIQQKSEEKEEQSEEEEAKTEEPVRNEIKEITKATETKAEKPKKVHSYHPVDKHHIITIVLSSILGIAAFIIGMVSLTNNGTETGAAIGESFGILYVVFSTAYCMISGSYVLDVFLKVAATTIKFPGLIFTWDLDGIMWLIGMKILFMVIGFLFGVACAIFAIVLAIILSVVSFPFLLIHNCINGLD